MKNVTYLEELLLGSVQFSLQKGLRRMGAFKREVTSKEDSSII